MYYKNNNRNANYTLTYNNYLSRMDHIVIFLISLVNTNDKIKYVGIDACITSICTIIFARYLINYFYENNENVRRSRFNHAV